MIPRRFFERYGLPIVSLVLAALLWFYVVGQKESEWTFSAPVFVRTSSNDIAGWSTPEKVSVQIKGPQRLLDRINPEELVVRLGLAEDQPGAYTRSVLPSMIGNVPEGVDVTRIEPAEVRVEIRPLLEIRYRVAPQVRPSIDGAFRVGGEIEVEPKYVELRGTRIVLQDITEVRTEPIIIEGPPGRRSVKVTLVEPEGARVFPQSVTVTYEVISDDTPVAPPGR